MNNTEEKKLISLFIDLNDRSSDNPISEKISELNNAGHFQVNLEIKNSLESKNNIQLDVNLFSEIKAVQDLPDWVIIKLILTDNALDGSKIFEQIRSG